MSVQPVEMQPGPTAKHNSPAGAPPPGLEYLAQIDQVLIHQQVELLEVLTGFHCNNKYVIKNSMGQQVYFAAEDSEVCMRLCCGSQRGFKIDIVDNTGRAVARFTREFKCCYGCCWCATKTGPCAMEVVVEAPIGQTVGYVRMGRFCCNPIFYVMDINREEIFMTTRSCCMCQDICCTGDLDFNIYPKGSGGSYDEANQIGKVSKQWAGCVKESFTNASNFGLDFPLDLDVRMKITLFGLAFMIDFMYFEDNGENSGH